MPMVLFSDLKLNLAERIPTPLFKKEHRNGMPLLNFVFCGGSNKCQALITVRLEILFFDKTENQIREELKKKDYFTPLLIKGGE